MRRSCVRLRSTPRLRSRSRGSAPSPRRTASRCTTAPTARRSRLGAKQGRGRPVAAQAQAVVEAVERCRSVRQWGEPAPPRRNRSGRRVPHALPHTLPHALASRRAVCAVCCASPPGCSDVSPGAALLRQRLDALGELGRRQGLHARARPHQRLPGSASSFFTLTRARTRSLSLLSARVTDRERERAAARSRRNGTWSNVPSRFLPQRRPPCSPAHATLPRTLPHAFRMRALPRSRPEAHGLPSTNSRRRRRRSRARSRLKSSRCIIM